MKKAIICYNCKKIKKESESYKVKVEIVEASFNKEGKHQLNSYEIKTKICRPCAKRMGYKVKKTTTRVAKPTKLIMVEKSGHDGGYKA